MESPSVRREPTTYSYDNTTGLLEQVRYHVGSQYDSVFYSYDAMGQMTQVDDGIGQNFRTTANTEQT